MSKTWNVPLTDEQCARLVQAMKSGTDDQEFIDEIEYLVAHSTEAR